MFGGQHIDMSIYIHSNERDSVYNTALYVARCMHVNQPLTAPTAACITDAHLSVRLLSTILTNPEWFEDGFFDTPSM